MSTTNKCKKCGCQDQALTTPIVYPTPAPCPKPEPCSEAFDSKCVYYTDDDILCGTDIVVHQDDTIETALNDIVDYFCNNTPVPTANILKVTINKNLLDPLKLDSTIVGGTGPFIYNWSIAQNVFMGHNFNGSTTINSALFTITTDGIRTVNGDGLFQSLIKLEVTDANGAYGSAYYTFSTVAVG
jgi:hypothetical protein